LDNTAVLDEVFNQFLEGPTVFKDREVLRHDYIPESLPHREDHIRHLGQMVAPVLKGARCSNIFLYGKTGTGKTAVTRFVLSKLGQKAAELGSPIKVCYINCRLAGTEYRVFSYMCETLNVTIPFTGLALGEVFDRFKNGLDARRIMLVTVLDEIDALVKERGDILLYELTRINESLHNSKTSIVGISNDLRFKEFLEPRVLSSLSEEEVVFQPYNAAELSDILRERAKEALNPGVLSEGAISLCSALAASEHGDARRALDLLRVAGELAERKNALNVNDEHVREAEKRIEHDRVYDAVRNLPSHSKLVLCSVYLLSKTNVKRIVTGEIFEVYVELCGQIEAAPLTQRRVSDLINELDSLGLLNTQVVSMGRYGRTKKIRLSIAPTFLKNIFVGDTRFERLLNYSPRNLLAYTQ
jgi:cell division control protein 6